MPLKAGQRLSGEAIRQARVNERHSEDCEARQKAAMAAFLKYDAELQAAALKIQQQADQHELDSFSIQQEGLRAAFDKFDSDKSGKLDHKELRKALGAVNLEMDSKGAKGLISQYDEDQSGTMEFDEFKKLAMALSAVNVKLDQAGDKKLRAAFDQFDSDKSGKLDHKELRKALGACKLQMDSDGAKDLISQYDDDQSGMLEFDEFKKLAMALSAVNVKLDDPKAATDKDEKKVGIVEVRKKEREGGYAFENSVPMSALEALEDENVLCRNNGETVWSVGVVTESVTGLGSGFKVKRREDWKRHEFDEIKLIICDGSVRVQVEYEGKWLAGSITGLGKKNESFTGKQHKQIEVFCDVDREKDPASKDRVYCEHVKLLHTCERAF